MLCPACQTELVPVDRQGVEIDLCPRCRGVWVTRKELDRVLTHPSPFDVDWDAVEGDSRSQSRRVPPASKRESESGGNRVNQYWSRLFSTNGQAE
ncbi:MAG TPA: zf-TFIIB domain-containing protein [Fimbriiglobus sp.]|jgi:Zn-finger nucleic acid-binding protein